MKLIVDKQKQLNIYPFIIYFIVSPKEYNEYKTPINKLNNYKSFTRNTLKFKAIPEGKIRSNILSDELSSSIILNNIIVRLFDDNKGNYNYATTKITLNQDPIRFEQRLQEFITYVLKQNIQNLDIEKTGNKNPLKSKILQKLQSAINITSSKHDIWKKLTTPFFELSIRANYSLPPRIKKMEKSIYHKLSDKTTKDDFKTLMTYIQQFVDNIPDVRESNKFIQGVVDETKSKELNIDHKIRVKPNVTPDITVSITKINKKKWGFSFNIDGETTLVYIGSKAAAMVYICSLLKTKTRNRLYRNIFQKPLPDSSSKIKRSEDVVWLNQVYRTIYPGASEDFNTWYEKMKKNSCHFINQGKSQANRDIVKQLSDFPNAIYFCSIQTENSNAKTFYHINLPPKSIIIPEELQHLISTQTINE